MTYSTFYVVYKCICWWTQLFVVETGAEGARCSAVWEETSSISEDRPRSLSSRHARHRRGRHRGQTLFVLNGNKNGMNSLLVLYKTHYLGCCYFVVLFESRGYKSCSRLRDQWTQTEGMTRKHNGSDIDLVRLFIYVRVPMKLLNFYFSFNFFVHISSLKRQNKRVDTRCLLKC